MVLGRFLIRRESPLSESSLMQEPGNFTFRPDQYNEDGE